VEHRARVLIQENISTKGPWNRRFLLRSAQVLRLRFALELRSASLKITALSGAWNPAVGGSSRSLISLHGKDNSGTGFAPSCLTHVVPRLRRRKHGAPVPGDRGVQNPRLQPRDGQRRSLDNSDSRSASLLMTKRRMDISSGNWFEGSQVSKARPHGTPGQAGAPFGFTLRSCRGHKLCHPERPRISYFMALCRDHLCGSPGNPGEPRDLRFALAAATLCTINQQETMEWDQAFVECRGSSSASYSL